MANKKVSQLVSKPSVLVTDLFPIADPTTGQLFKTTISDLGTAIGSGVSSVNTLVGAVVLDTDDIQELASPTNRWFTDTRARAALSASSPLAYNSGTGVFSIPQATGSQNGFLSSADWTTFNAKQTALSGTGFVKISGTTISYDNSTYALDSAVVKLTGTQSISGVKTFNSQPVFGNTLMLQNTASGTVLFGGYTTMWTTDSALTVLVGTASSTTIGFSLLYDSSAQRSYTMPTSNGTLALTSQLSAYLPLSGGTLTGELNASGIKIDGDPLPYIMSTLAGADLNIQFPVGQKLSINDNGATNVAYFGKTEHRLLINGSIALTVNSGGTSLNSALVGTTANFSGALSGTSATFSGFLGVNGSPGTSFPLEAYINSSTAYTTSSRGNVMRVYNSNTGANIFSGIEFGGAGTANDGLAGINGVVTGNGSAALTFYTRDSNTFSEKMRIASSGAATFRSSAIDVATFRSDFGQMGISLANGANAFGNIGSGANQTSTAGPNDVGIGTAGLNNSIVFATGSGYIERLRINSSGLKFQNGASYLSYYEEGTWTIGISFGGGTTGITYGATTGTYTRIGRQVTVNGYLNMSNKGSSTGVAKITGLPFTLPNNNPNYAAASLYITGVSFANQFVSIAVPNTSTLDVYQISSLGVASLLTNTNFGNSVDLVISLTYFV